MERENGVVKDTTPPAIVGCIVVVQPWQQIGDRRAHHALSRCGSFCLVQVSYEASTDNVTLLIIAQKQEKKQGDNDKETVHSRCCNYMPILCYCINLMHPQKNVARVAYFLLIARLHTRTALLIQSSALLQISPPISLFFSSFSTFSFLIYHSIVSACQ